MLDVQTAAIGRANEYAKRRNFALKELVGFGQDGVVYSTDVATAVKSFKYKELYRKELAVYERLRDRKIEREICGFSIPQMISHHDELLVIEMEFVTPPFVVDFASAGVDEDPLEKYDPEILAVQHEAWRGLFENRWPEVRRLLHGLRSLGIFLADLNTNNITFEPANPSKSPGSPS